MTQKDFLIILQKSCQLEQQQCSMLLNALSRLMANAGVEQVPVTLPGLGTFTSHKHPEYIKEDPETGQQTLYPPRITYRMQSEDEDAQPDLLEKQLSEHAKTPINETSNFLKALVRNLLLVLDRGEEVEVKGLGTFKVINSNQGEIQRIAYTPDEQMKQLVNAPFNCFEPVVINANTDPVANSVGEKEVEEVDEPVINPPDQEPVQERVPTPIVEPVVEEKEAVEEKGESKEVEKKPSHEEEKRTSRVEEKQTPQGPVTVYYDDDYEDESRKSNRMLLYTLISLIFIALGALAWFLYDLCTDEVVPAVEVNMPPVVEEEAVEEDDEPATEVFFGQNGTIETEGNTDADKAKVAEESLSQQPQDVASSKGTANTAVTPPANLNPSADTQSAKSSSSPVKVDPAKKDETSHSATTPIKEESRSSGVAGRLKNADGSYTTYKLKAGERLTLVALDNYGDKCFWPYIYEVNKDKLKSPSVVPIGTVLYLPDPAYFGIDVNNPESVQKAKNKAAALLSTNQ